MALKTEVQQGGSGFVSLGEPTRFDPKATLAGVCWDTSGNAGTTAVDFIGTSDNQPLSIRANSASAIQIQPSAELTSSRPITHNIIEGSRANGVISPARGATISGGGSVNDADPLYTTGGSNRVDDHYGAIGGGFDNQAGSQTASASDAAFATVGGAPNSGDSNGDEGSFVWADQSSNADFVSAQSNQFIIRAANGVGINTNSIGGSTEMVVQSLDGGTTFQLRTLSNKSGSLSVSDTTGTMSVLTAPTGGSDRLQVLGGSGGTATLTNGGTWTNASSRSYKENFSAVNAADVLSRLVALPIMTWDYIGSAEGLHMGPVAEDFKESFGLAGDGKSISTVDADGIALAAIQGLNAKLETENDALRARLDALEARLR